MPYQFATEAEVVAIRSMIQDTYVAVRDAAPQGTTTNQILMETLRQAFPKPSTVSVNSITVQLGTVTKTIFYESTENCFRIGTFRYRKLAELLGAWNVTDDQVDDLVTQLRALKLAPVTITPDNT